MSAAKKAQVKQRAKPNVNAWMNGLIDRALKADDVDWDSHFEWLHEHGRKITGHPEDELRRLNR